MSYRGKRIAVNISSVLLTLLLIMIILFSVMMLTFNMVYIKTCVRGFSMYPTLNANVTDPNADGDIVYINKYSAVERGDIAVARVSWWSDAIIKRVVGVPGDTIKILDMGDYYALYVNNSPLIIDGKTYERDKNLNTNAYYNHYISFIENEEFSDNIMLDEDSDICIKLNENEYFLMSDNWAGESIDCMINGPVKADNFVGRVDIIVHVGENEILSTFSQMFKLIFA